jgi:hypothetical protein
MKYDPVEHGSLNDFIHARSEVIWADWQMTAYGDQDFTAWDRYHEWLMARLNRGGE